MPTAKPVTAAKATAHAAGARFAPLLERALLLAFVIHGLAMLGMALLLLPGMPGGPNAGGAARVAYVAAHPWRWRLGWLPWQLTALSDLLIALALLRTAWIPRRPAVLALAATLFGILPDQTGQFLWITQGIGLAQAGNAATYLAFEQRVFSWIAVGGGTGYTLSAVAWSICLAQGGAWTRGMTYFSIAVWSLFGVLSLAPLLPDGHQPAPAFIAAGNALGFVLLLLWLALAAELVLRRARPDTVYGRYALWRHPRRDLSGRALNLLANSRFMRALCEFIPSIAFRSDISDVLYVNYIVNAEHLEPLVPMGLALQRLGPGDRCAMFTFLTYRHGHFGPRMLGPLRSTLPSPIQTNWRIYVYDPQTGMRGVYFVSTAISSAAHALVARLLAEGMSMHLLDNAAIVRLGDGGFYLRLDPGGGSAPVAAATLRPSAAPPRDGPWHTCFATYHDMLAYCVPQDRALSMQPWHNWVTRQEITLDIPLEACEPLEGEVRSPTARAIVGDAKPFCFRVARVDFRFTRERHDKRIPAQLALPRP
jgi:hypothetical protein